MPINAKSSVRTGINSPLMIKNIAAAHRKLFRKCKCRKFQKRFAGHLCRDGNVLSAN